MNGFEKIIKEKSQDFGDIKVEADIWNSIESELLRQKKSRIRMAIRIAASFLFVITSAVIFKYILLPGHSDISLILSENHIVPLDLKNDFNMDIQKKLQVLRTYEIPVSLKSNFAILIKEFHALDKNDQPLDKSFGIYANSQSSENQLLNNYRLKLKILERIEAEIIKINKIEKDNNYENKKVLLPI